MATMLNLQHGQNERRNTDEDLMHDTAPGEESAPNILHSRQQGKEEHQSTNKAQETHFEAVSSPQEPRLDSMSLWPSPLRTHHHMENRSSSDSLYSPGPIDGYYTFIWAHPATTVYIAGSFNGWLKLKLEKGGDGSFTRTVHLQKASMSFKFVVDDIWVVNHSLKMETDEQGVINNILSPSDIKGWREVKEDAAKRQNRRVRVERGDSETDHEPPLSWDLSSNSSGKESISSRVERIKARVAELTATSPENIKQKQLGLDDDTASHSQKELWSASDQASLYSWDPDSDERLVRILSKVHSEVARETLKLHGISDLWLPIPRQTLQKVFLDKSQREDFLRAQDDELQHYGGPWRRQRTSATHIIGHAAIDDDEDVVIQHKVLGEGAYGTVEEVTIDNGSGALRLVRKQLGRPKQLKAQQRVMAAFAREINVMQQVDHQHCVKFIGSYTDLDHVNILSSPVADMDLAIFLDRPIGIEEKKILYRGIGCLCNAINYLHQNNIRHEDLKPQNVLIHGNNILLTDFGFSLDFSDDCVSTTTGRPSAWTIRYSAPEVLNFEPRNRATDIFSLGCVLIEMLSGLHGHSLATVKDFWKHTGNGQSSFARNMEAATSWNSELQRNACDDQMEALCTYTLLMLAEGRSSRPTAQQVVKCLSILSRLVPEASSPISASCMGAEPCIGLAAHSISNSTISWSYTAKLLKLAPNLLQYLYPWAQHSPWNFRFLDLKLNPKKYEGYGQRGDPFYGNVQLIREICHMLHAGASRTGTTKIFWKARESPKFKELEFDEQGQSDATRSAQSMSVDHVVFSRIKLRDVRERSGHSNSIQISLLPIHLRESKYYGSFFYMLSYPLLEIEADPRLPAGLGIVDLTKIDM